MTDVEIDRIIEVWRSDNIKLSPPTTIDAIKVTEEIISYKFPSDFKEFYLKLDGFIDCDWTKNMFSIWPLSRIAKEFYNETDKNFIAFADYLISSYHIGFIKGENGIFKNCGTTPELIAKTFSEIISLINLNANIFVLTQIVNANLRNVNDK